MTKPDELKALRPDLVVEIAARSAVAPWAAGAFAVPSDFAVVSTAALGDPDLKSRLIELARDAGRQLVVIPGALGGFDALRAAAIGGLEEVEHVSTKPPRAWRGTPAEELVDLDACRKREVIFEGPAARAAELFPQNANVASTLQFVVGDAVRVKSTLLVDPDCEANEHHFKARGQLGVVEFKTVSVPTPENPKSSIMTALSIVRTLENRFGPTAC
jgi:aspartate dehydrogenase